MGKNPSGLWPVHLKPQSDELLSSWLVRLARGHGLKLHTFCSIDWPGKQIWNRDIDKSADAEILETLSTQTSTNIERVQATALVTYENVLYERHNMFGPTPWIMPVGIYHRRRRDFGMQFCPRCLAEDKEPYYRRKWRLAFMVLCESHHILLHDRCPKCGEPINFHRGELGNPRKFIAESLTLCHVCFFDLQKIEKRLCLSVVPAEVQFTVKLLQTIDLGFIELAEGVFTYAHLFFMGLRQLLKILAMRDRRIINLRQAVYEAYEVEIFNPPALESTDVQELGIEQRRALLGIARCLLENWPQRFISLSCKYKVWSSLWLRHLSPPARVNTSPAPFWFWSIVHDYLYRAKYRPSNEEIRGAIMHLKLKGEIINQSKLARLLGVAVIHKKDFHSFLYQV